MTQSLYKFTVWISQLAILNLLWLGFSFLGLVVFGFFPATVAMFIVLRSWLRGEDDLPIFSTFWQSFRTEFLKANGYGLIIVGLGGIVYSNLIFMSVNDSGSMLLFHIPLYTFVIFVALTLLYLFPVYAHYDLGFFQTIKQAFLIMMIQPIQTVVMIIGIVASVVVMRFIPALPFFFGGSFIALLIMATCYHSFQTIEQKQKSRPN